MQQPLPRTGPAGTPDHPKAHLGPGPRETALPEKWDKLWGSGPAVGLAKKQLADLKVRTGELASSIPFRDERDVFSPHVGSVSMHECSVHRWFSYKEAFSPALPDLVLRRLQVGEKLIVADFFGGVATTAVSLLGDPRIAELRSLEYSPLAYRIGCTKLKWPVLRPDELRRVSREILGYRINHRLAPPGLSAFSNPRIFEPSVVASLQSARNAVNGRHDLSEDVRQFLLVGVAAITESVSFAMRDGRALRILGGRKRWRESLVPRNKGEHGWRDPVKIRLEDQWSAMIEDLEDLTEHRAAASETPAWHVQGDARRLRAARLGSGERAFPVESVDVAIYSPPYLNFIDYSEVYKLELWLLNHVETPQAFRRLRLGTLRSHPSVRFGERVAPSPDDHEVVDLYHRLGGWLSEYGARPEAGRTLRHYFEDMQAVFEEQFRILKPGGSAACVVANSTFSRRTGSGRSRAELWRMPVLTDVILAGIAESIGFVDVEVWHARDLRPRNVASGVARESIVVMKRPT